MNVKSVHELGTDVVRAVVDDLFRRFMNDEHLYQYFSHMRLSFLKIHSLRILKTAYLGNLSEDDLARIFKAHEHLFRDKGLGLLHYNRMIYHVEGALIGNGVPHTIIEKAMKSLDEIKVIFQSGTEYNIPTTPKKSRYFLKSPGTPTTPREELMSPNSLRRSISFRERLTKSPSFMRRSIRIITKGAA